MSFGWLQYNALYIFQICFVEHHISIGFAYVRKLLVHIIQWKPALLTPACNLVLYCVQLNSEMEVSSISNVTNYTTDALFEQDFIVKSRMYQQLVNFKETYCLSSFSVEVGARWMSCVTIASNTNDCIKVLSPAQRHKQSAKTLTHFLKL